MQTKDNNREEFSIDNEIDKLDSLTKRYSHLRKDLASIEEDLMTLSLKKKLRADQSPEHFFSKFSYSNNTSMIKDLK